MNTKYRSSIFLQVQYDGNLVLYRGAGPEENLGWIWASGSVYNTNQPHFLVMQDDGNLVLYRGNDPSQNLGAVWSTETNE